MFLRVVSRYCAASSTLRKRFLDAMVSLSILLILNADYLVNARRDKTAELILRGVWAPTVPGATDVSLLLHCDQSM